ncbi:hypothetical protein N7481_000596 [Penicillium waksmanii]|uniref:uncharacterized protein n=1 Tax=Penicillium waksmanii TaxID=69791 RepID=UPI002548F874|nr:uncharacterized protein N7481_000596 [Penicillium waksmanii]KAJ6000187.1 hypothetical protein N7481_000596 [Penicillium waksmanii]
MRGYLNPRFSGKPGDNVNQFIKACHCIPPLYGYTEAQLNDVRAVTLYQGTSEEARKFLDKLPESVQDDFVQASTQLKEKFPWKSETEQSIAMEKITNLKQAEMPLYEYVEQGTKLQAETFPSQHVSLCQWWLLGLKDQLAANIAITAWLKHADGELSFDKIVHYVRNPGLKYEGDDYNKKWY